MEKKDIRNRTWIEFYGKDYFLCRIEYGKKLYIWKFLTKEEGGFMKNLEYEITKKIFTSKTDLKTTEEIDAFAKKAIGVMSL